MKRQLRCVIEFDAFIFIPSWPVLLYHWHSVRGVLRCFLLCVAAAVAVAVATAAFSAGETL